MIVNICVNRLDDLWLSHLDFVDTTMFMPHGWILGAKPSDHTEDDMTSVVFYADSEFVFLIRTR